MKEKLCAYCSMPIKGKECTWHSYNKGPIPMTTKPKYEHTPTGLSLGTDCLYIRFSNGHHVAIEKIKAANQIICHEELLEACKIALSLLRGHVIVPMEKQSADQVDLIVQAITNATKESNV